MFCHFELSIRFPPKQIFATDLDSGLNGETEYSILSGNENATFLMDSARGILATNTILNRENTSSYRFVCRDPIKPYSSFCSL